MIMTVPMRLLRSLSVLLVVATAVVAAAPGLATRAEAVPPQTLPMRPCPPDPTTGTCIGADFPMEDDGGGGGDGDAEDPPSNDRPEGDGGGGGGGGESSEPSPEEIQQQLLLEIDSYLLDPIVATDPGLDRASVLDVPTFVAVTNWQGQEVDTQCLAGFCVTITATAALTFDPGEPGAPIVACEPGGTRFDPDGPDPREQAARPGACAHAYQHRTGVAGRPDAWPGQVTINWTLEWTANFPLPPGLPTSEVLTAEVPRVVAEAPTVVVRHG
jgi:hypothetical protein